MLSGLFLCNQLTGRSGDESVTELKETKNVSVVCSGLAYHFEQNDEKPGSLIRRFLLIAFRFKFPFHLARPDLTVQRQDWEKKIPQDGSRTRKCHAAHKMKSNGNKCRGR